LSLRSALYQGWGKDGTDRQTDGRTPDRFITLTAKRGQRHNIKRIPNVSSTTIAVAIIVVVVFAAAAAAAFVVFGLHQCFLILAE